ncbi:hypothetical protein ISN45_At02g018550 [Arabidopsis thaliana x Arabidopsis arenosa]|uniref:Uncharacterized protein n=2 Tax=Arabidopsis TaxID=3701 RepID=A0A8T2G131_ARASU|nr:hypothetical protein ISN45_At02g018550 [Arabidopsis thaliana x Arabidopsis arenosa]KAG7641918.1 hypothetical protein ISN44_As02g018950 [Arabidopsis suecica]
MLVHIYSASHLDALMFENFIGSDDCWSCFS